MIAVAARTVRAMASQFFVEFGACGLDLAGSVFDTAADTLAGIESRVINATGLGFSQLAGASIIALIAATRGPAARGGFPALPP